MRCELQTKPEEHVIGNGYNHDQVKRLMHDARLARKYDKALRKYGQHTYECASHNSADGHWLPCDCGWEEHPLNDA